MGKFPLQGKIDNYERDFWETDIPKKATSHVAARRKADLLQPTLKIVARFIEVCAGKVVHVAASEAAQHILL